MGKDFRADRQKMIDLLQAESAGLDVFVMKIMHMHALTNVDRVEEPAGNMASYCTLDRVNQSPQSRFLRVRASSRDRIYRFSFI